MVVTGQCHILTEKVSAPTMNWTQSPPSDWLVPMKLPWQASTITLMSQLLFQVYWLPVDVQN